MPDVNLLKDTQSPEDPKKATPPRRDFELSTPVTDVPPAGGGFFKSLFSRRPTPAAPTTPTGKMSLRKGNSQERILSETKSTPPKPGVIPLPEDDGNYNVNLLSEDLVGTFDPRQKMIQLGLIALAAVAVVVAGWFGLRLYANTVTKQVDASRTDLARINQEVQGLSQDQGSITATAQKLTAIRQLVDRHVRWTKFFAELEHYTLPQVTYGTSFTGDVTGSMALSASAGSFDDVAKQYLIFQQAVTNHDFISSFAISGANTVKTQNGDKVNFTINLTILPELLENTTASAATTGNVNTNTTTTTNANTTVTTNTNTSLQP